MANVDTLTVPLNHGDAHEELSVAPCWEDTGCVYIDLAKKTIGLRDEEHRTRLVEVCSEFLASHTVCQGCPVEQWAAQHSKVTAEGDS